MSNFIVVILAGSTCLVCPGSERASERIEAVRGNSSLASSSGPSPVSPLDVSSRVATSPTDGLIQDSFDSYAAGSVLTGQGLWKAWWGGTGVNATVTNVNSNSAPNAMRYEGAVFSDMVIEPEFKNGVITFACMTYMPGNTGQVNDVYIIALNDYKDNGGGSGSANWSLQVQFHAGFGFVAHQAVTGNPQLPLIFDLT